MNNKCYYCNRRQEHFADGKQLCWYHYPLIRGFGRCSECDYKYNKEIIRKSKTLNLVPKTINGDTQ